MNARRIKEKLDIENCWKELAKQIIDKCNNYNDFQKLILKLFIETYYEDRKNTIIRNDIQAKLIEDILNDNK